MTHSPTAVRHAPLLGAVRLGWGLACVGAACFIGCDRPQVVKPPVENSVNITSNPSTLDPVKPPDSEKSSDAPTPPSPKPASQPVAPQDVQQLVATLSGDTLTRVWVKGTSVDVVLSHTLIRDDDLPQLAGIAGLRSLNLDECRELTSAGLSHLASFRELRKLSLSRTAINDAGLVHVAAVPGLTELVLTGTADVTDKGMSSLARCANLQVLRLKDTRVGDPGLAELHALAQLREIWLDGTRVTEQGMAELEQVRPGLKIVYPGRRKK